MPENDSWQGKRVTVMGLGTRGGGSGVARYLAEQGANVSVTDLRTADQLADQIAELDGYDVRFVLGGHVPDDFTTVDAVIRNPAVRRSNPFLAMARDAGIPVEMEMSIFLRACPARVIGITGTKGKTTTSALCGEMLRSRFPDTVVAGNMGVSALAQLPMITVSTPVVLEISSWQLEAMDEMAIGPAIAVLTNISEDHLDTYKDFAEYADTKRSIAHHQERGDVLVLNADDRETDATSPQQGVRLIRCGRRVSGPDTILITDSELISSLPECAGSVQFPMSEHLRGEHQRSNAALAAAAALAWGACLADVVGGLRAFSGVRNRMEIVAEIEGVVFVNDTAATAPAAAMASLRAWTDRPVHLIAGGADKRLDFAELGRAIAQNATTVTLLGGTATASLVRDIQNAGWRGDIPVVQSMAAAVEIAAAHAEAGSVVLLSPGCASFGIFRDEFDRGDQFREHVHAMTGQVRS